MICFQSKFFVTFTILFFLLITLSIRTHAQDSVTAKEDVKIVDVREEAVAVDSSLTPESSRKLESVDDETNLAMPASSVNDMNPDAISPAPSERDSASVPDHASSGDGAASFQRDIDAQHNTGTASAAAFAIEERLKQELESANAELISAKAKIDAMLRAAVDAEQQKKVLQSALGEATSKLQIKEHEFMGKIATLEEALAARDASATSSTPDLPMATSDYERKLDELHAAVMEGSDWLIQKYWEEVHPKITLLVHAQYKFLWNGAGFLYYDVLHGQVVPYITGTMVPTIQSFYRDNIAKPMQEVHQQQINPWFTENVYPHYQEHLESHVNAASKTSSDIYEAHVYPLIQMCRNVHETQMMPLVRTHIYGSFEVAMEEVKYTRDFTRRLIFDEGLQAQLQSFAYDWISSAYAVFPWLVDCYAHFLVTHATILASVAVFMTVVTICSLLPIKTIVLVASVPVILVCFPTITLLLLVAASMWLMVFVTTMKSAKKLL